MASQKMTKVKQDKIEYIAFSKLDYQSYENARGEGWLKAEGDDTKNSFSDLITSIDAKGQTTAVFARPNPDAKKAKKQPYQIIAGFRRMNAFAKISERDGSDPLVKVIVRDLSDYEARALNIEENTAREELTGPDLAWAIDQLSKQAQAAAMPLSDVDLAAAQGISPAYGNRLLRIMRKVDKKITAAWRKAPIALSIPDMDSLVAITDPVAQRAKYDELIGAKTSKDDEKKARGPGAWVDTAKQAGAKIGSFLALAEDAELLTVGAEFDGPFVELLVSVGLMKYGKNAPTEIQLEKIANAITLAYGSAVENRKKAEAEKAAKAEKTAEKPAKKNSSKGSASASADN